VKEPQPYHEAFPAGTTVRIADRASLEEFMATWKYHHKLKPDQLAYADRTAKVKGVGAYHGGDMVYTLEDIPGLWLEQCLREP
jgi:carboxylesterase type B